MASDSEEMDVSKEDVEEDDDDDSDDRDFDQQTSSDSEIDQDEVDEEQQETELLKLREIVNDNPYIYQSHLNYIGLAKKYCNLDHLRFSRQKMSEIFPLTEELWLDWLQDEQKLLSLATDNKRNLTDLFERAVNDYLSVKIWIEFIQYRISIGFTPENIDELRNLCELALSQCACHLTNGHLVWAAYIEIEKAKLIGILSSYNQNSAEESKEKLLHQVDFILKLYRRQLSIPLRQMQNVYDEYKEFCQEFKEYLPSNYHDEFDVHLKNDFDKAVKHLEKSETFEKELEENMRHIDFYRRYIEFEREPTRIQCLYERAIVDHCLNGDLWLSYFDFLEEKLNSSTLIKKTFERSLRNVPWIANLWIRYAEFVEFEKLVDHSQLKDIFDRGLNSDPTNIDSFVKLQLSYLQYRRRHYDRESQSSTEEQLDSLREEIRRACETASSQYQDLFFNSTNPKLFLQYSGQIEMFWIHLEVKSFHSIKHARNIWNGPTLMNKSHNQMISNLWKQYYYMEISYGDTEHAGRVLRRALNKIENIDHPKIICDLVLDHETKYGTIEELKQIKDKLKQIHEKLPILNKPKKQIEEKSTSSAKKPNNKNNKKEKKPSVEPTKTNEKLSQRPVESSPRKRKLTPEETESVKKKTVESIFDSDGFKVPLPPANLSSSSNTTNSTEKLPPTETDHSTTVFISNLPFAIKEETIRQAFLSAGPIKEIRLIKREWSGKTKGFGYIDFQTAEGYREALKLDNTPVGGRPVYVSPYDSNRSTSDDINKKFKYATSLEQNKLFVSDLPFSLTKEDLAKIFVDHGFQPKQVRLVTYKSGKPKGLAYVEFNDANQASQAVIKVDNHQVDGHNIKVMISNPPKRAEQSTFTGSTKESNKQAISLGAAPKSTQPRGKGYSQIALVPRQLAPTPRTTTNNNGSSSTEKKMNNDDFRQMLLNKK